MFVGEIGFPRHEFLYHLQFWEARCIEKGYRNRHQDLWQSVRWMTYQIMSVMPYCDLRKAGITSPSDLIKFPWDEEVKKDDLPTDEEVEEIRKQLIAENNCH